MPTIICHPENWELVKRKINKGDFCKPGHYFEHFNIRTNEHMDKDKPTGKFRLPVGKVVERDIVIRNAVNLRRWGTTQGLGELAEKGNRPETKADACGVVRVHQLAVVSMIDCKEAIRASA